LIAVGDESLPSDRGDKDEVYDDKCGTLRAEAVKLNNKLELAIQQCIFSQLQFLQ